MAKHTFLILGNYGSGKTVSAATIAGICEKKVKYLALDQKIQGIYTTKDSKGKLIIPKNLLGKIDFLTISDKQEGGKARRPVFQSPKKEVASPAGKYISKHYDNFTLIWEELDRTFESGEYDAIVLDSLTELMRIHAGCVKNSNNIANFRIQDYGTMLEGLRDAILPTLLEDSPVKYFIMIGHLAFTNEDRTEKLVNVPIANSQSQSLLVPSLFSEVYIQVRDKKTPMWYTSPQGLWTGSSKLNVPEIVNPADFRQIKNYLT